MHWRWDAVYYYNISVDGYHPGGITAFFPLFPMLSRGVATLLNGLRLPTALPIQEAELAPLLAGIIVAHLATFGAFWMLHQLALEETGDRDTAFRAILYAAIFPFAYHYATPYTEGLFLLTTVASFLAMRRKQWVRAGIWAACASATRFAGILLVPVLCVELLLAWRRGDLQRVNWPRAAIGLVTAPLGLLLYMGYLWWRVGDAFSFYHVQSDWGREQTFPMTAIVRGIDYALHPNWSSAPDIYARGVLHTIITFAFLGIMLLSIRAWRLSYLVYGALLFIVILWSPPDGEWTMHNLGRYLMILFPVYITLARWGRSPAFHLAVLMVCVPMFGLFSALYVRWYAA